MKALLTPAGEALEGTPWQIHPQPQFRRENYVNLNGTWDFTVTQTAQLPQQYDRTILVPFCPESSLSGIGQHFPEGSSLFYRRSFSRPQGERVLLHIGAADQITEIYVNQQKVGSHTGGYEAMCFDITAFLEDRSEVVVRVTDDLRDKRLPYGKQVMDRGGMWYTPVSGIWQTVWLEIVPEIYVNQIDIQVTLDRAVLTVTPPLDGQVECLGKTYPLEGGRAEIVPETPHLWTPEDPYLYPITVRAGADVFGSYFALRTLEQKTVKGLPRLCLNGKPYFFHGLLDQGYWPDGLFTPASPDCYTWDIQTAKDLGFNTLRKHIKVEPEQFYYECDRLGMIVFQDMVNNSDYRFLRDTAVPTFLSQHGDDRKRHRDPASRKAFLEGMTATVTQLKNHPCICYWTIFNEGWGQFDSANAYRALKKLDSSRFIDTTSGWFRGSESDVESLHIYFGMWHRLKKSRKPLVLSEFGGFAYSEAGHIFNPDKTYGYGTCKTRLELDQRLLRLYKNRVLPAVEKGLCGSIYTQISDVEDEINGLVTYDRRVLKVDSTVMRAIAQALQAAIEA